MTAARTPLDPRTTADRLTAIRDELNDLAKALHNEDFIPERNYLENAAENCDYAVDSLMALANGDDGQE